MWQNMILNTERKLYQDHNLPKWPFVRSWLYSLSHFAERKFFNNPTWLSCTYGPALVWKPPGISVSRCCSFTLWVILPVVCVYSTTMLSGTDSTLHVSTPGEMKRAPWLSMAKHETLSCISLADERLCVRVRVWHKNDCEYINSVRYQQSTIHQMNKNNRSNPDVILLLRLWCNDVIGNNSSLTTKWFLDTSQRTSTDGDLM